MNYHPFNSVHFRAISGWFQCDFQPYFQIQVLNWHNWVKLIIKRPLQVSNITQSRRFQCNSSAMALPQVQIGDRNVSVMKCPLVFEHIPMASVSEQLQCNVQEYGRGSSTSDRHLNTYDSDFWTLVNTWCVVTYWLRYRYRDWLNARFGNTCKQTRSLIHRSYRLMTRARPSRSNQVNVTHIGRQNFRSRSPARHTGLHVAI